MEQLKAPRTARYVRSRSETDRSSSSKHNTMYLAVNKLNTNEFHSFEWAQDDRLMICGASVDANDWEIIYVEETC